MNERETLDTNDKFSVRARPTREPSAANVHAVRCGVCDGLFYIDDATFAKVRRAAEFDPSDNPFVCERCEDDYADEEHRV
jgi:hypothetical protein